MSRTIDYILEECLYQIKMKKLTLLECLDKYPEFREELEPILKLALTLKPLPKAKASKEYKNKSIKSILSQLESERKTEKGIKLPFFKTTLAKVALAITIILCILIGLVYASSFSLANSPLYSIKRATENIQVSLTFGNTEKSKLHLKLAEKRSDEIKELVKQKDAPAINKTAQEMKKEINHALQEAKQAPPEDKQNLMSNIVASAEKQQKVLKEITPQAPEEAKTALMAAAVASYQTQQKAQDELKKIAEKVTPPEQKKEEKGGEKVTTENKPTPTKEKKITRLFGLDRDLTSVEISKSGWNDANTVIICRGDRYPDALVGASLSAKYNAPILLNTSDSLKDCIKNEIIRLQAKKVFILGTEDVVSPMVVSQIISQCNISDSNIYRLGGSDRYETAAIVAQEIGIPKNHNAIITTGIDYPDALTTSPLAIYNHIPILLVKGSEGIIPDCIKETLEKYEIKSTIVVGGPDVVSEEIYNWLNFYGYSPTRLCGDTRYDTCLEVTKYAINQGMNAEIIGIASGENFPDALTLGPFIGKLNGSLLLVKKDTIPKSVKDFISNNKESVKKVYLSGDAQVISNAIQNKLEELLK